MIFVVKYYRNILVYTKLDYNKDDELHIFESNFRLVYAKLDYNKDYELQIFESNFNCMTVLSSFVFILGIQQIGI